MLDKAQPFVLMKIKLSSSTSAANGVATVSVASRLDEAIAVLGSHDAIKKLRGIRSHAQYVLHSVVISLIAVLNRLVPPFTQRLSNTNPGKEYHPWLC